MKKYHIEYVTHTPSDFFFAPRRVIEYGDVSEGRLLEAVTAILANPTSDEIIITRCKKDEH